MILPDPDHLGLIRSDPNHLPRRGSDPPLPMVMKQPKQIIYRYLGRFHTRHTGWTGLGANVGDAVGVFCFRQVVIWIEINEKRSRSAECIKSDIFGGKGWVLRREGRFLFWVFYEIRWNLATKGMIVESLKLLEMPWSARLVSPDGVLVFGRNFSIPWKATSWDFSWENLRTQTWMCFFWWFLSFCTMKRHHSPLFPTIWEANPWKEKRSLSKSQHLKESALSSRT